MLVPDYQLENMIDGLSRETGVVAFDKGEAPFMYRIYQAFSGVNAQA